MQSYPGVAAYETVTNVIEVADLTFNGDSDTSSDDTHVHSTAAAAHSSSTVSSSSSKGLGKLVEDALQCRLDKTMQRSDWQRRPLTPDQV
jgi:ribonuclease D